VAGRHLGRNPEELEGSDRSREKGALYRTVRGRRTFTPGQAMTPWAANYWNLKQLRHGEGMCAMSVPHFVPFGP